MSFFKLDMLYGVKRQDDRAMVKIDCARAFAMPQTFMGLPVRQSDLITQTVEKKKTWKRRGRPNKVRIRYKVLPSVCIMDDIIIAHPKAYEAMLAESDRKNLLA